MTTKVFGFALSFLFLLHATVNAGLFSKTVEANPEKEYVLSEQDGPWLIHVKAFSGPNARPQANALVFELRKSMNCKAFLYEKTFVHDVYQDFDLAKNPNSKKVFRYQNKTKDEEFAVVVGNFPSLEDNNFKKTLAAIKKYQPKNVQSTVAGAPVSLSLAFGFANPMQPPVAGEGTVDKFVESININRPYTLLRNPARYTVQIATFSGRTVMQQDEIQAIEDGKKSFSKRNVSELELGERAAVRLCKALREQGVEAYEFHSRYESIVTIGSFNHYGRKLPNGATEFDPAVLRIVQRFQGQPIMPADGAQRLTYQPVIVAGVECDAAPKIIEVPRCRR